MGPCVITVKLQEKIRALDSEPGAPGLPGPASVLVLSQPLGPYLTSMGVKETLHLL